MNQCVWCGKQSRKGNLVHPRWVQWQNVEGKPEILRKRICTACYQHKRYHGGKLPAQVFAPYDDPDYVVARLAREVA